MKREEVSELVDRGLSELNDALANGKSDRLKDYLAIMARFPKYSFNNAMLIYLQAPDSSLVQGFHAWRKLGRTVIKGQKGIGIIAPLIGRKKDEDGKPEARRKRDGSNRVRTGFTHGTYAVSTIVRLALSMLNALKLLHGIVKGQDYRDGHYWPQAFRSTHAADRSVARRWMRS